MIDYTVYITVWGGVFQNARLEGAGGAAALRLVVPALSPAAPHPPPVSREETKLEICR